MASGYRPGSRRANVGKYKISKNRIAWARTSITQLALMRYTPEEMKDIEVVTPLPGDDGEVGDTIRLMISTTSGRPYTLNLTAMTKEEYTAFFDLVELAKRMVLPIVEARDKKAQEAYANGDDAYTRSYRQLPQFIIRAGSIGQDDPSLFLGLEYAIEGPGAPRNSNGGLRGGGDGVADPVQADSGTEDNGPTLDEPPRLG